MRSRVPERVTQRVVLRTPQPAAIDEQDAIVLELGAHGAKIEHKNRLAIGTVHVLRSGGVEVEATVRHSTMLPTKGGMVFHTGLEFEGTTEGEVHALYGLLLAEAEAQVREWEANVDGVRIPRPQPRVTSSVERRFLWLHLTDRGWHRHESLDPNQPIDGISVLADEPEDSIRLLCSTYEKADQSTREYLRRCAALAILESMQR